MVSDNWYHKFDHITITYAIYILQFLNNKMYIVLWKCNFFVCSQCSITN